MNFYCCVHSQEAIDTRKKYALDHDFKIDLEIPWKYICGTKARNDFTDNVINAYDGNVFSKYNKWMRNYTSLLYILNRLQPQRFMMTQCTLFSANTKFQDENSDILTIKTTTPYGQDGNYVPWLGEIIKSNLQKYGEDTVIDFFKQNFYGFDILGKSNYPLILWLCYINGENPYIREMLNETVIPFCNAKYIALFHGDIIPMVLNHIYQLKYVDKISISETLNAKFFSRKQGNNTNAIMHYYGD